MILLLLNCSKNYLLANDESYYSTGEQIKVNTIDTINVIIPIKYIRCANDKLIERLYLKENLIKKDSIILLKNNYINEQSIIIKDFQNRIIESNKINLNLQNTVNKRNKQLRVWKYVTFGSITIIGTILLIK